MLCRPCSHRGLAIWLEELVRQDSGNYVQARQGPSVCEHGDFCEVEHVTRAIDRLCIVRARRRAGSLEGLEGARLRWRRSQASLGGIVGS